MDDVYDLFQRGTALLEAGDFNSATVPLSRARDLDAHSWVEVWFEEIGWVPFDPTPAASPARRQADSEAGTAAASRRAGGRSPSSSGRWRAPAGHPARQRR